MPELRRDPITGRWVVLSLEHPIQLSPGRAGLAPGGRAAKGAARPHSCPLCPGNEAHTPPEVYAQRPSHGPAAARNAPGWSLRVVPHKFPALMIEGDMDARGVGLYDRMNGVGAHEVVVETAEHGRRLHDLSEVEIEQVLWAYRQRIIDLKRDTRFRYILVFRTEGGGGALSHAHSQIVALPLLPRAISDELSEAGRHHQHKDRCLFCDVIRQEIADRQRLVYENSAFVVFAPYASRAPFELCLMPRHHRPSFEDSPAGEYAALSGALRAALRKLDRALADPCYSFTLHNAPFSDRPSPFFHWHIEILPALGQGLGPECVGLHVNPTPPEEAAQYLRDLEV
jgi:UDPglucose--hexose-1-phosphate uridylyltransferase